MTKEDWKSNGDPTPDDAVRHVESDTVTMLVNIEVPVHELPDGREAFAEELKRRADRKLGRDGSVQAMATADLYDEYEAGHWPDYTIS